MLIFDFNIFYKSILTYISYISIQFELFTLILFIQTFFSKNANNDRILI